ncbi:MAG TPA: hypothetical protein ENK84_07035 [Desulfobulbus sp.]|nr:hypothetical protein [Desulfobulbus sp.]
MPGITVIVMFLLLIIPLARQAHAAEFTVANVAQLQAALTTAASDGVDDTIWVAGGTYNVTSALTYNANNNGDGMLKIVALNSRALPLFDGSAGTARIMVFRNNTDQNNPNDNGADIMVEGIVFRNGNHGGLFIATGKADIQINKCLFMDNQEFNGSGASLWSVTGAISVIKNTFIDNSGTYFGGGLYVNTKSGFVQISNNHFSGNTALNGGGAPWLSPPVL